jgi:TATA-box binding protein (TBP) (component of TFIID and TFIIIB)
MLEPKIVLLIFVSGKLVLTGAKVDLPADPEKGRHRRRLPKDLPPFEASPKEVD